MEKGPIYFAIKNRRVVIFLLIFILLFGLYSYENIPKQENPEIVVPFAYISTVYPGASPEEVERLVTSKIEDKVVELEGYDYSHSYSRNSISTIIVRLEKKADVEKNWSKLREKMSDLQSQLPDECQEIQINTDLADTAGFIISLVGSNYSYEELADYAEDIKKDLVKVEGLARVEVIGKQEKEIKIKIDTEKLNFHRLSLEDIVDILKVQNAEIPAGAIKGEEAKINVKVPGSFSSFEDINNLIIEVSPETGAVTKLKDIAEISWDFAEANYKTKQREESAILIAGYFKANENIVHIGKVSEKVLEEIKNDLPPDIDLEEVLFQPRDVHSSVTSFVRNLLQGIAFVIVVVFLGMGIRNAGIISTAIPISILITFSVMLVLGIKIHQVSIVALIIALGMLVDNAIVISDSIQVRIDNKEDKLSACINGAKEVAIPVLSATLTTIAAFLPLLFIPSVAGEYIASIPQIVMISLLASYLVALFVTPSLAYLFFKESKKKKRESVVRRLFRYLLNFGLVYRKLVLLGVFFVFAASIFLSTFLGLQFFPKADKNIIYIDVHSEHSSDLEQTEEIAASVWQALKEQPEVVNYTTAIGGGLPKFFNTMPVSVKTPDSAQVMVLLDLKQGKRFRNNTQFIEYVQNVLNERIINGTAAVKELEQGEPIGAPIQIRVTGKNMGRLEGVAEEIKDILAGTEGTLNIESNAKDKHYEYVVYIDNDQAQSLGFSKYAVQKEISTALKGSVSTVFRQGGNEYDILVVGSIESIEELENLAIKSSVTGRKVLLKQIAQISLEPQLPEIKKYDRELAVTVFSDIKSGFSSVNIQKQVEEQLPKLDLETVKIVFDGEGAKISEYFGDVGTSAIFAVFIIYTILLIQFNSLVQPLIVLVTNPLSVIGSVLGLIIFKQNLSFTALLGIVSLIGIVVNNAIVLIDFINVERAGGKSIKEACVNAVEKRLRPIILSTTTTIVALGPLLFSKSNLFVPMSISLMSGLFVSTLLTLIVIPVTYSLVEEKLLVLKFFSKEEN
ncbi:MAG: hypothetical protein JM58_07290 [Peptococcaceae bacterium BICA1-8]|nr:MAG: hypothetical protein JM58_07290 [Peptococcaceae bacterium BICA1-8]